MSVAEMKRFTADCRNNPDLAEAVAAAGTDLVAIVAVANAQGYEFTVADAQAAMTQAKLNQEQLGQLAGGAGGSTSTGTPPQATIIQTSANSFMAASTNLYSATSTIIAVVVT